MTRRSGPLTQNGRGHRPTNNWGAGDLPAPWAEGDIVDVPEGAGPFSDDRMRGMGPGRYVVSYATSIYEGDGWYFRLTPQRLAPGQAEWVGSDRLHVYPPESDGFMDQKGVDYMAGVVLVKTFDPDGLALRERMLADGWKPDPIYKCPTCLREMREHEWEIMQERLARRVAVASDGTVDG